MVLGSLYDLAEHLIGVNDRALRESLELLVFIFFSKDIGIGEDNVRSIFFLNLKRAVPQQRVLAI